MKKQYYSTTPAHPGATTPPPLSDDEEIIRNWNRDAAIRAEFGDLTTYAAWFRADRAGQIRVLGAANGKK